jgi:hypothetical protein
MPIKPSTAVAVAVIVLAIALLAYVLLGGG